MTRDSTAKCPVKSLLWAGLQTQTLAALQEEAASFRCPQTPPRSQLPA